MATDLCETCNKFDLYSFQRDPEGYRGYLFEKVTEGATTGCRFCSLLYGCFSGHAEPRSSWWKPKGKGSDYIHLSLDTEDISTLDGTSVPSTESLRVIGMKAQLGNGRAFMRDFDRHPKPYLHMVADPGMLGLSSSLVREISTSLLTIWGLDSQAARSKDIMGRYYSDYQSLGYYTSMLRQRINNCLTHETCCKSLAGLPLPISGNATLPTRCIELHRERVFLRCTKGLVGSYMTLSHRWNQETEASKTMVSNCKARKEGVWDCKLPKLFMDVLEVAKRLDVKYVWIDSLCIIQEGDAGLDWDNEAVKMAEYYENSLITVMATSATREHGLFPISSFPISSAQFARLPYRNREGQLDGHFFVYYNYMTGESQFDSSVIASDLLARAWVFQERHLSCRTVFFTHHGMFFECRRSAPINDRNERGWGEGPSGMSHGIDRWYDKYLSPYSGLHLTKPKKDRLVAVSGIMNQYLSLEISRNLGIGSSSNTNLDPDKWDKKVWWTCGLWSFDIQSGLVWQQNANFRIANRQRFSQYPSWSWASTMVPVSWQGMKPTPKHFLWKVQVMLEDVSILIDGVDGAGLTEMQSRQGAFFASPVSLEGTGRLVPVLMRSRFESQDERSAICRLSNSEKAGGLENEAPRVGNRRKVCLPEKCDLVAGWASLEHIDFQEDSAFIHGPVIYALAISCGTNPVSPYAQGHILKRSKVYTVLFVKSVVGGEKYERVGAGKLFGDDAEKAFWVCEKRKITLV
ncbi:transcription factor Zn C2H2 [Penicillium angulare]|uniref:transcription factor Zn C2H2 n=1 Tax=Penicillium angulare TaxID=116970 RepID=UPI0025424A1A|nr:transcription factor Zn C2H2 [Penicillium angulare]KAJ5257138.1 transcription factor Zn C2H2 [Penicillium angulare]